MKNYKSFIFDSYEFDEKSKILLLKYSFDDEIFFEEKIEFPTKKLLNATELKILNNIFKYLHLAAGISYYKLYIPYNIKIKNFDLNKEQALFFNSFYFNGLGEFSCKNNITDLKKRINFPYKEYKKNNTKNNEENNEINFNLNHKIAIPIGGGKDSVTTLNIIKKYKNTEDILTCSVGIAKPIEEIIKISCCKSFHPIRTISENLIQFNKQLDKCNAYNGHVPISGILAFILCASAIIYDYDTVLMSNERSANIGNRKFGNIVVNHQWSKSFEFEKNFNYFSKKYLLKNFNYFSFLRPMSEIYIAKIFSKFEEYHHVFTSCNKNFKIKNRLDHWCCDCDKCRFVFLILAVFLDKNKLINIFGKNLLEDENQLNGYLELCGLQNHKPFECVGEIEESVYSILNIDKSFENDFIVKEIKKQLHNYTKSDIKNLHKKLFTLHTKNHLLNKEFFNYLKINS